MYVYALGEWLAGCDPVMLAWEKARMEWNGCVMVDRIVVNSWWVTA